MRYISTFLIIILFSITSFYSVHAQSVCSDVLSHGAGFTTSIEAVEYIGDDPDGEPMYNIVLRIENDGCTDPDCKSLNHYSVEALPGTYSNISHATIEGNISYGGTNMGPGLGGVPFDGFRIANINGIGNGLAGIFNISYTLTGGLQGQQMHIKASDYEGIVEFQAVDFQKVLNCDAISKILPYYAPPESGKIGNSLIGAELTSLHETFVITDSASTDDIFQIVDLSNVIIEVYALDGQYDELLSLLQTTPYGMTDLIGDASSLRISGVFPILSLLMINDLPGLVSYARPVYPGAPQSGIVNTQGDTAMLSFIARNGFNVSGEGIKIGVLSDSYNTRFNGTAANDDVLRGDLPGAGNSVNDIPVSVLQDYPYGVATDEGRAMLQIIHDVAPKAELAFHTGLISPADFAEGIIELQAAGCDVIVDDITYISEPFFKDGIVSQSVETVVSAGVSYFTAAGNFGSRSYESAFNPGSSPPGLSGAAHNFASGATEDIYQSMTVFQGTHTIVLQWDDGLGNEHTSTDLDIYLVNDDGSRLFGFNRENIGGAPIEVLPFNVVDTAQTNIVIVNNAGPDPVRIKYIIFRGNPVINEYYDPEVSTIVGQANAEGAITVAATLYSNTPAYGVDPPTIASFSSAGGTLIDGIDRNKPEITAPNGVNTSVDLGGPNFDGDDFPNFFGTSASAPHVAGLAALLLEAKDKFYDGAPGITPAEMKELLMLTAVDMEDPGFDKKSGAGLVNAVDALLTLASPSPLISGIYYDTSLVPGVDTIQLSVIGNYLTEGSQIYFNGVSLGVNTILNGDTISGTILPYDDRYPAIQVYNPPNPETNGSDGGLSNSLYFTTKPTIVVDIDDAGKKFAELIPTFTASYSVESVDGIFTLEGFGLSDAEILRIQNIGFETVADDTSNVGLWEITPSQVDPLNPAGNSPAVDPQDTTLLYNYSFEFHNGLLTIDQMDLTIIPKDTTIVFGDTISGFEYYYIYNNDTIDPGNNVLISEPVDLAVLNALKQAHATALVNVVGTSKATALVNGEGEPLIDSASLANTSFFISNAVATRSATALVNGTLLSGLALVNALGTSTATALVNAVAMVRATALVNGLATVTSFGTATALVNFGALVNAASVSSSIGTALVNGENINDDSNNDAIVILGEGDILILSGDSIGEVSINSISVITGREVGQHYIVPGAFISNNFNVNYGIGKINVIPATATVTADLQYMNAGDSLPEFTATFDGLMNGDDTSVVTSLSFTLSPTYNGQPGTYDIIPSATADNYVFTPVNGVLYVNPAGPGYKHIKTQLQCVEELSVPNSLGHTFIANFSYENNNAFDLYIPIGEDNVLAGNGSYNGEDQVVVFKAGGGTWSASFDGTRLTWTVSSFRHNGHKTSTATNASSKSSKCDKSAEFVDGDEALSTTLVYPNPVSQTLTIERENIGGSTVEVRIYDVFGKEQALSISGRSGRLMEIGMAGLKSGIYFIKILDNERSEVIRVIKQ